MAARINSGALEASKLRFAKIGENLLNRFARSRGNQLIQVEEGIFEVTGERPADGRLARAHESHKKNGRVIQLTVWPNSHVRSV